MTNKDAWKSISKTLELADTLLCDTCKGRLLLLSKQIEDARLNERKRKRPGFKNLKEAFIRKYTVRIQQRGLTGLVDLARKELEYSPSTGSRDILFGLVRIYNKLNPDNTIERGY